MDNSHLAVWFFLDSSLPAERNPGDFFAGAIGLSGSDGTLLRVAKRLSDCGLSVCVHNLSWEGTVDKLVFRRVATADEFLSAVGAARPHAVIFNYYVARPAALQIAHAPLPNTRKLLWDQNGADFRFIDLARRGSIDEIIAVSHTAREWFRSTSAFGHTRVIYNLCDDVFFAPLPRRPDGHTVLFVGALRPVKGFHALAAAWPHVHRNLPAAELVVAGSDALHDRRSMSDGATAAVGEYHETVVAPFRAWAERAGANVRFLGTLSPRELVEWHSRAVCCVVNPSEAGAGETFCCAAVEAELCGNPVVSVCNGSLPEVTQPGTTSLLSSPGKPTELAANILQLLRDPSRTAEMSTAAMKFAQRRFDSDSIVDQWRRAISAVAPPDSSRPVTVQLRDRFARDALRITRLGDLRRRRRDLAAISHSDAGFPYQRFRSPGQD